MPFCLENMGLINGKASQHLQYLPYGESFVEQKTTATYYTPYRFSAKEKDDETQYSYFGARYYDSDLSVWLSVDPMSEKHPELSPYNYCSLNPLNRFDPNGETDYILFEDGKIRQIGPINNEPDRLITIKDGKITYIIVNDKSLLKNLSIDRYSTCFEDAEGNCSEEGIMRYGITRNKSDIVNIFLFVSKNSKVEWAVYSTVDKRYAIGTKQFSTSSPSAEEVGLKATIIKAMVHNHNPKSSEDEEMNSLFGDKELAKICKFKYYTYYGNSKNLYEMNQNGTPPTQTKDADYKTIFKILD